MTIGTIILILLYLVWSVIAWTKIIAHKVYYEEDKTVNVLLFTHWILYAIATFIFWINIIICIFESNWWNYKLF